MQKKVKKGGNIDKKYPQINQKSVKYNYFANFLL